jgi:cation diffusion facilitator family transporter
VCVLIDACLAVLKGITGVVGNSYALIADAMESVMDIVRSLILLGGLKIASVPPDVSHPYGHGKAEPLAAIVVAVGFIGGALGLAIQSVREILTPHGSPAAYTLAVLALVIVSKELLFRFLARVSKELKSSALTVGAWDKRSDALTSGAAFIGISVALIGGEGYEAADDWAALAACAVIAYNGYRVLMPAIHEVMDAASSPEIEELVRRVARAVPGVVALDVCTVRKMGLEFFVDLHVWVEGTMTVHEGHEVAHRVKDAVRHANPQIRDLLIHIEPAVHLP